MIGNDILNPFAGKEECQFKMEKATGNDLCEHERYMWYVYGGCAMAVIARSLKKMEGKKQ